MTKKNINVMLTAFRDGFQSVYGARVFTKDFMPAVEAAKNAGITHFEAGGGARFQSLFMYSDENAFDMMDEFRRVVGKEANLQTLARGINVVGLDSQPKDIIKLHADLFKKHGMTTIRNFDALNDVNNLIYSGKCIVDAGLKHEVVVTMMALPPSMSGAHTPEFYEKTLRKILDSGIEYTSVCFKDASGTSTPDTVYKTIKMAKSMLPENIKVVFHSHDTAGTCLLQYKAALNAGVDQIDLSMSPVSGGTAQPDIISMWHALRGTKYDLGIDINKMIEAEEIFKDQMKDYFVPPESKAVEPMIPFSPMPGGALTANTQMLRDNNLLDKYPEIIKNMEEVVAKGGFGTSVTPVSQFYFQQAFNNTMFGKWEKIADGYGKMVLGYFGKTPSKPNAEIIKIAEEKLNLKMTTENPVDLNDKDKSKGIESAKKMLTEAGITDLSDENIFIAAACKEKGIQFLQGKGQIGVRKIEKEGSKPSGGGDGDYTVTVNGKNYSVEISGDSAKVNGKSYDVNVKNGIDKSSTPKKASEGLTEITAPMNGNILSVLVSVGDIIEEGDEIVILEAMKMESPIKSTVSGTVTEVEVSQGDNVETGHILIIID